MFNRHSFYSESEYKVYVDAVQVAIAELASTQSQMMFDGSITLERRHHYAMELMSSCQMLMKTAMDMSPKFAQATDTFIAECTHVTVVIADGEENAHN